MALVTENVEEEHVARVVVQYFRLSNFNGQQQLLYKVQEEELLQEAGKNIEKLTGFKVELHLVQDLEHDAEVTITTNRDKKHHFVAEIVRTGSRTTITRLITRYLTRRLPKKVLLITDYVSSKNADILRRVGIQFIDASGNSRINTEDFYLQIQGQKRVSKEESKNTAFRKSGLKVIFALLVDQDLANATYRDIADLTDVSHGTVGNVMRHLEEAGFIQRTGRSRRRITEREELLNRWVTAYPDELRPTLRTGRLGFKESRDTEWRTLKVVPELCQWGGEPAAAVLTNNLRPEEFVLYTEARLSELAIRLDLKATKNGQIEVLNRFWKPEVTKSQTEHTVHPLLVYADLLASGDPRNIEVADELYESRLQHIK